MGFEFVIAGRGSSGRRVTTPRRSAVETLVDKGHKERDGEVGKAGSWLLVKMSWRSPTLSPLLAQLHRAFAVLEAGGSLSKLFFGISIVLGRAFVYMPVKKIFTGRGRGGFGTRA